LRRAHARLAAAGGMGNAGGLTGSAH
jgi:hypothetical protein